MPPRPVVHFEIHGKDRAKLSEFYRALFEWELDPQDAMDYTMVAPGVGGPAEGVGGGIAGGTEGAPFVTVYVQVPDPNETLKKAESLGGKTVMPPMDVPGGPTIAQLQDPEGNLIGLVKQ
jgi:predicted enzyme related to lactoylglutathione lyase